MPSWPRSAAGAVAGKGCSAHESFRADSFQCRYRIAISNIPHTEQQLSGPTHALDWVMAQKDKTPHSAGRKSVRVAAGGNP